MKIISLDPHLTEIVIELGAKEKLIAITYDCPLIDPYLYALPRIGSSRRPNLSRVSQLKPDIVLAASPIQSSFAKKLRKAGVKCMEIRLYSLDDLLSAVKRIGKLVGDNERLRFLIGSIKLDIEELSTHVPPVKRRVYLELSREPLYAVGKNPYLDKILHFSGGVNIFSNRDSEYVRVSASEICEANPQVIFLLYPSADPNEVKGRVLFKETEAVEKGKIYKIANPDLITVPSLRFPIAVELLKDYILRD